MHPYTRRCGLDEERLHTLTRNLDVPFRLFLAGIRLFADSIIVYDAYTERTGPLRFYPPVIMTFWSGFETFIRYQSELLLITVKGIPRAVENYLMEQEDVLNDKGEPQVHARKYKPVLSRYLVLLRYGYNYRVVKGDTYWQQLVQANELRDYFTHLKVNEPPRPVSSTQVVAFMEAVLIAIIKPSCDLRRDILPHWVRLYDTWAALAELQSEYTEQPFFADKKVDEGYLFDCKFDGVDEDRFPLFRF